MDVVQNTRERFEEVAICHFDAILETAVKMTHNVTDAEDLVQDVFFKAWRFFDKFQEGTNCKAWLFKILKNTYINKIRKDSNLPDLENIDLFQIESKLPMPDHSINDLLGEEVTNAMEEIMEEYKVVVSFVDIQGNSYSDTASILDIPLGTVMSRLHRGRKLIREALSDYAKNSYGYEAK